MKISFTNNLELNQKLTITPKVEQALKILQMGNIELLKHIEQLSLENPLIEIEDPFEKEIENLKIVKEKIDWLKKTDEENKYFYQNNTSENMPLSQVAVSDLCLEKYLLEQLNTLNLSKEEHMIGKYLINCLDKNGYLVTSIEDISNILLINTDKILHVLINIIQTFEPSGVGARSLSECLLIQLKNKGVLSKKLETIVKLYLEQIAQNKLNYISKKLDIPLSEVVYYCEIIKSLNPKPGSIYTTETTEYVVPDVIVKYKNGYYNVELNDSYIPKININNNYKTALSKNNPEIEKYIDKKFEQALWIYRCINQRKETLFNVSNVIVKKQIDFFKKGPGNLKPLVLRDIAEELSIHESTVSRATNDKWLQCSWGIYELKSFFTSSIGNHSSDSLKHQIKKLIDNEDKFKPLSDQKITDILKNKNIKISRRTVAKYREEMNIPSTTGRKRYK